MPPRLSFRLACALLLAACAVGCGSELAEAAGGTSVECLAFRCDSPNPSPVCCPDKPIDDGVPDGTSSGSAGAATDTTGGPATTPGPTSGRDPTSSSEGSSSGNVSSTDSTATDSTTTGSGSESTSTSGTETAGTDSTSGDSGSDSGSSTTGG